MFPIRYLNFCLLDGREHAEDGAELRVRRTRAALRIDLEGRNLKTVKAAGKSEEKCLGLPVPHEKRNMGLLEKSANLCYGDGEDEESDTGCRHFLE